MQQQPLSQVSEQRASGLPPHKNSIPLRLSGLWATSRDATWLPTVHTDSHLHLCNPYQSTFNVCAHNISRGLQNNLNTPLAR